MFPLKLNSTHNCTFLHSFSKRTLNCPSLLSEWLRLLYGVSHNFGGLNFTYKVIKTGAQKRLVTFLKTMCVILNSNDIHKFNCRWKLQELISTRCHMIHSKSEQILAKWIKAPLKYTCSRYFSSEVQKGFVWTRMSKSAST